MAEPRTPLRVGMAGAGAISTFHLKGWQAHGDAHVVAICDPERPKAQERAAEHGIPAVYDDAAEMLAQEDLGAIDIVAPVGAHAPLVRLAADAGVHVMCQKPLCATVAEAEALIDDVGDRVRFMVHENYCFRPHYATLRGWLNDGRIGRPTYARMVVRSSGTAAGDDESTGFLLRRQPYLAGFERLLVFEVLIHHLDVLRATLGPLRVVAAQVGQINGDLAGEDVASVLLEGENGLGVILDGCISAPGCPPLPADRFEIGGDRGVMVFDRDHLFIAGHEDEAIAQDMAENYQACFTDAIADFVRGLRDGTPFQTDRRDNLETLRLMESIYRAAGVPVS